MSHPATPGNADRRRCQAIRAARVASRARNLLLLALLTVFLTVSLDTRLPAYTFLRTSGTGEPIAWDLQSGPPPVSSGRIQYWIDSAGTPDTLNGPVSEFAAIRASFHRWEEVADSAVAFTYAGAVQDGGYDANDDRNVVFFDSEGELGPGVLGLTVTTFNASGDILDADIALNDNNYTWDTLGTTGDEGTVGRAMVENIVTHEVGHLLGLDHSFARQATMVFAAPLGAVSNYFLHPDDVAGIGVLYPNAGQPFNTAAIAGHVTGPNGDAFGVNVVLLDTVALQVVASSLTDSLGNYEIAGVPPGEYHLLAAPVDTNQLSQFYDTAETDIGMQIHGVAPGTANAPDNYRLIAGQTIMTGTGSPFGGSYDTDFVLDTPGSPAAFEPNGSVGQASPLLVNTALTTAVGSGSDQDYFSFTAAANDVLDVVVVSANLNTPLDAQLTLYAPGGTEAIASPVFGNPAFVDTADDADDEAFDADGNDLDPRLRNFVVPVGKGGTLILRIGAWQQATSGQYALFLRRPGDDQTPDPVVSTIDLDPPTAYAGDGTTPAVHVFVRNQYGAAVTNSPTVEIFLDGVPQTAVETSPGSGIFFIGVPDPGVPDSLSVEARVTPSAGSPVTLDAMETLYFTGPVAAGQSEVTFNPPSLFADGNSTTTMTIQPRDVAGRPIYDPSAVVTAFVTTGAIGTITFDAATGTWRAALTAGESVGTATLTVQIDGVSVLPNPTIQYETPIAGVPDTPSKPGGGSLCGMAPTEASADSLAIGWLLLGSLLLVAIARRQ